MSRRARSLSALLAAALCLPAQAADYRVVGRYPHDRDAYTQGLLYFDGHLYESTGLYGRSSLRQVEPHSGKVVRQRRLHPQLFGEGLALVGERFIQLTWRRGLAIVYDRDTLELLRLFRYDTEGWGLTYDGERLIMSDGSARLYFRSPEDFSVLGTVEVRDADGPVPMLNELEYIDDEVWANVYQTPFIVRIDPQSGRVRDRLDLSALPAPDDRYGGEDVLNGIAYDAAGGRLFVTGKLYAYLYQIELN